ncbi:type III-B CRISPR module-associated protein Cmr5 [Tuwongella immobilis]|uniref:CRISPR type III-B/RAMP module-associated protein Cmr5 n=1 Tax=Tuwongella immobilis TaxID=692036 RepID=A0A6C2YKY6_9BACT|nr:type III-B CRISPR module-associated protein Cmr5 [Tuwongella immobilis]VIP02240.1 CRISPR-associated protein, Cmr5 family OS=Teredinibacter turnerae (strain ATCC 39867 / T7901) GN=cmr5 PE=4 SV=1: Cas_Cmr5 [Tuwongella immobilis]VTS00807.1 CRISPR-associated protein, Cmr5 family OS=Teredinibacter turnerae (strain ATCC 39867 / T7901) GN=cmr5 PE=4 SV=1: Cas_Cmr5 [Tuwongella immobilis]
MSETRSQKMAQTAYERVNERFKGSEKDVKEYTTFAKKFPALVHTCGLAQALAFAKAKDHSDYLDDLREVLGEIDNSLKKVDLIDYTNRLPLVDYMRLSRDAISAASWLKRYVEAEKAVEKANRDKTDPRSSASEG